MDNTINKCSNLTFGSRYLKVKRGTVMPKTVLEAIKQNPVIDAFLKEGTPKTFWGKIGDLFKRKEILEIFHSRGVYAEYDRVYFILHKRFGKDIQRGYINVDFHEILTNPNYKSGTRWSNKGLNHELSDENMVKQIGKIKSMDDIFAEKARFA